MVPSDGSERSDPWGDPAGSPVPRPAQTRPSWRDRSRGRRYRGFVTDAYDLQRFVQAQHVAYEPALAELRRGRKHGHWMWYTFPQLRGLGHSHNADLFGISGLAEATAYLRHPVLEPRLVSCARAVAASRATSAAEIFGELDAIKLRSSMTLFSLAAADVGHDVGAAVFGIVLDRFYSGRPDPTTLAMLRPA